MGFYTLTTDVISFEQMGPILIMKVLILYLNELSAGSSICLVISELSTPKFCNIRNAKIEVIIIGFFMATFSGRSTTDTADQFLDTCRRLPGARSE